MTAISIKVNLISKKSEDPWIRRLRAILHNSLAIIGFITIAGWLLIAIFAGVIAPYDPMAQNLPNRLQPPSAQHWFGTDELGRDQFSRLLYGTRISLLVGLVIIVSAAIVGSVAGLVAGYYGSVMDMVIMRLVDLTLAFPPIVLAMAITAFMGPGLFNAVLAMILVEWPAFARLMRGQVLSVKNSEYITAAVVVGVPRHRILFRHILSNAYMPVLTKASLDTGTIILFIAALSFIGLGVVPPTPEWGAMISNGRLKFYNWWLTTFPGLAMLSVVLGFNFIGDGVRDALDPHMT
jgi:ABC-type dipeptide/oligopeptide/nickel transport system permease subunit